MANYTERNRLEQQLTGSNINIWGDILNALFGRLDESLDGVKSFALSGTKTLITANDNTDEAHFRAIVVTSGSGGSIIIPPVQKIYLVKNNASGDVSLLEGAGAVAIVKPSEMIFVMCDGVDTYRMNVVDMMGQRLRDVGTPLVDSDAATKAYADGLAFGGVELPGQGPGTIGAVLRSDGTTAGWALLTIADVPGAAPVVSPVFMSGVTINGPIRGDVKQQIPGTDAPIFDCNGPRAIRRTIAVDTTFTFSGTAAPLHGFIIHFLLQGGAKPIFPASVRNVPGSWVNGNYVMGLHTTNGGTDWILTIGAIW